MVIYISGPITGIKDRNKKVFQKAQNEIASTFQAIKTKTKVKIVNPVKLGLKLDKVFALTGKVPAWEDYMRACIKELCDAKIVFFLPNWKDSEGAVFEKEIATRLKIPCAESMDEFYKFVARSEI